MIQMQVRVDFSKPDEYTLAFDVLEREDASEAERQVASTYERVMRAILHEVATRANLDLAKIDPPAQNFDVYVPRPAVCWFADLMERALRANDDLQVRDEHQTLWDGLLNELMELREAERFDGNVVQEAADAAAFLMMLADRWNAGKPAVAART